MDRLELMEVNGAYPTPEEVDAEMPNFIARCQEMIAEHYKKNLTNIVDLTPQVYVAGGRKYIKVAVRGPQDKHGGSVYCFVRAADGAILKAATWKAPALNFTRGNIFDKVLPMTPYGVRY